MQKINKQHFLQSLNGRQCKGRVLRLMKAFPSFEEFVEADKGKLMAAEKKTRPFGKRGLGAKFFADLESVKATACEIEFLQAKAADDATPKPVRQFFTVGQLKAVTTLMELCEIDRIDISKIVEFLDSMGAKV